MLLNKICYENPDDPSVVTTALPEDGANAPLAGLVEVFSDVLAY